MASSAFILQAPCLSPPQPLSLPWRFLTYLARSRRAEKNVVVVSHGHMMEACALAQR